MEEIQAPTGRRTIRALVIVSVLGFLVTCAVVACGRALKEYGLGDSLGTSAPVLELHVAYYNTQDKKLDAAGSAAQQSTSPADVARPECAAVAGGDKGVSAPRAKRTYWGEPTPVPCPLVAYWNVYRHPVAFSMYVTKGADLTAWYDKNSAFLAVRDSVLWQGVTRQLSTLFKVRAEDLELEGFKGQFLQELGREALAADAVVHYDVVHGAGGVVFSFVRDKAPILAAALPVIVKTVATNGYRVAALSEPIIELRMQGMRLYLVEQEGRVLVGSSLEGLLNVIAEAMAPPPALKGSVTVVVRTETYLDKLLKVATGAAEFPVALSFDLSENTMMVAEGLLPKAHLYKSFGPSTSLGVLAAVPHDALGALVMGAHVPVAQPVDKWTIPAQTPTTAGGISLVWDMSAEDGSVHVGIAVPAPPNARNVQKDEAKEDTAVTMKDYLSDNGVSSPCAGGALWLVASSDRLLARMKDSCEKQSLSVLDLKGLNPSLLPEQQLSLFFNTSVWLKEMYRIGGGATPRQEATDAEKAAVATLLANVDALAATLPVIGFTGKVDATTEELRLKGFSANVGGV